MELHTIKISIMKRKDKVWVQELLVVEYDTDGSIEFITGEQLEIWYRDKIKGTVTAELEFNEAVQEAIYKACQGEIFWWVK